MDDDRSGGPGWPALPAQPPTAPPTAWPTAPSTPPPGVWPGSPPTPPPTGGPGSPATPPPPGVPGPGGAPAGHPTLTPPPAPGGPAGAVVRPALPRPGALAALAGVVAAVAPLLRWFDVDLDLGSGVPEVRVFTSGWGATGLEVDAPVPVGPTGPAGGWSDWVLAGIPDGAIATVLGVVAVLIGVRLALGLGAHRTLQAAAVTALGGAGLAWMGLSWVTAQRSLADQEDLFATITDVSGPRAGDLFTLAGGPGFFACAAAFAVVTLAGLGALWSATGRVPAAAPPLPAGPPPPFAAPSPVPAGPLGPAGRPSASPPPPPPGRP